MAATSRLYSILKQALYTGQYRAKVYMAVVVGKWLVTTRCHLPRERPVELEDGSAQLSEHYIGHHIQACRRSYLATIFQLTLSDDSEDIHPGPLSFKR